MRTRSRTALMVGSLAALTAVNVAYHKVVEIARQPGVAWEFPLGEIFPPAPTRPLTGASAAERGKSLTSGCRLFVFFDVDCAYCEAAKIRESGIPDSVRLPVLWLSVVDDVATTRFEEGLSGTSAVRYVNEKDLPRLVVRATPVAFLVDEQRRVQIIVPYDGTEAQHRGLRRYCKMGGIPNA